MRERKDVDERGEKGSVCDYILRIYKFRMLSEKEKRARQNSTAASNLSRSKRVLYKRTLHYNRRESVLQSEREKAGKQKKTEKKREYSVANMWLHILRHLLKHVRYI